MRALIVSAGNPVLSVPDGDGAVGGDARSSTSLVSIDFYVNETSRARRLRPAGDDVPRARRPAAAVPRVHDDAVRAVDRRGRRAARRGARGDGDHRGPRARAGDDAGLAPGGAPASRRCSAAGSRPSASSTCCCGPGPGGSAWRSCAATRTGSCSASTSRPGRCAGGSATATGASSSAPPQIAAEVARLRSLPAAGRRELPLRLIGLRELRSHNSWMHNAPKLMTGDRAHRAARAPGRRRRVRRRGRRPRDAALGGRRRSRCRRS